MGSIFAIFLISVMSDITSRMRFSPYSDEAEISSGSASGSWHAETRPSNPADSHSSSAVWGVTGIMAWIQIFRAARMVSALLPPLLEYHLMSLYMSK